MPFKNHIKKALATVGLVGRESGGRHALVGQAWLAEMKRAFQISFLKANGLLSEHRLLDLGCGTLRGGIPIIGYLDANNYFGIDVRREAIEEARLELCENGLEHKAPLLIEARDAPRDLDGVWFDFVWAFSVLIHMSDATLGETMGFVAEHLKENGAFYANVRIGIEKDGWWQGFPVVTRPLTLYERAAGSHGMKARVLGSLESLGHVTGIEGQDQQVMLKITRMRPSPC